MATARVGDILIGEESERLTFIAGPCVVESLDLCREVAGRVQSMCADIGFNYIFKASFDKANRTAGSSYRGRGMEAGLTVLDAIKHEFGVPVLTDIHEASQAAPVAEIVDVLQIPAFLSRQTDLLVAAAETGRCVNVKKGQFLAPWDMKNVAAKLTEAGCKDILLTERGVSFGYNTLVVDMCALPQMRALGFPVCFDATHSVQQPGGAGASSGGRPEFIPTLARAATAAGIDALFMEVHPEPEKGLSDAATMFPLDSLPPLLRQIAYIHRVLRTG